MPQRTRRMITFLLLGLLLVASLLLETYRNGTYSIIPIQNAALMNQK